MRRAMPLGERSILSAFTCRGSLAAGSRNWRPVKAKARALCVRECVRAYVDEGIRHAR